MWVVPIHADVLFLDNVALVTGNRVDPHFVATRAVYPSPPRLVKEISWRKVLIEPIDRARAGAARITLVVECADIALGGPCGRRKQRRTLNGGLVAAGNHTRLIATKRSRAARARLPCYSGKFTFIPHHCAVGTFTHLPYLNSTAETIESPVVASFSGVDSVVYLLHDIDDWRP